jgi:hypothetical protein
MSIDRNRASEAFSSNAVRLSIREWCALFVVLGLATFLGGGLWKRIEAFDPPVDYRIPFGLSEDYWLFNLYCGWLSEENKTPVFGDSFVWGQYVGKEESLTHFLNQEAGSERFANAGLDGAHPMALGGLIEHHCAELRNRDVILHLNLLWLSSQQADLPLERELHFNHPRVVPQFTPRLPSCKEPISGRIGTVMARYLPVFDWVRHVQAVYLEDTDLGRWTLQHPYDDPLSQISLDPPGSGEGRDPDAQPWFVDGRGGQKLPWVELETSQQWRGFQRAIEVLRARGNRVYVIIGPLNEHMITPSNAEVYRGMLRGAETWLRDHGLAYSRLPLLPSESYADLSHPLGPGYAFLAEQIWEDYSSAGETDKAIRKSER